MNDTSDGTPTPAKFEGWAILEMMGHQREIGFITTEYFGATALFRVDVPALEAREYELQNPEWEGRHMIPAGSKVKRAAVPGRTRFVAPGALYALNPCSETAALKAIEQMRPRAFVVLELKDPPPTVAGFIAARKLCGCDPDETCEECEPEWMTPPGTK